MRTQNVILSAISRIIIVCIALNISICQVQIMEIIHLVTHNHDVVTIDRTLYLKSHHASKILLSNRFLKS